MDYSTLNLDGFSFRDKKIIKDNPNKTLQELAALALSDKAYSKLELMAEEHAREISNQLKKQEQEARKDQNGAIQPVTVKTTTIARPAQPVLTSNNVGSQSVWLFNKTTNNRVYMSRKQAEKLVRNNPNNFKIVG